MTGKSTKQAVDGMCVQSYNIKNTLKVTVKYVLTEDKNNA